jgi:exosortase A
VHSTSAIDRRWLLLALGVCLLAIAFGYRHVFLGIWDKWLGSESSSHGLLVLPVSAWLAWQRRDELARTYWHPDWAGVALLGIAAFIWIVGAGTGVLMAEQLAVVLMIQAAILTVLGRHATAALGASLLFLFFAVPVDQGIVPLLMKITANISVFGLEQTGVPVYRSEMFIRIPEGNFEVARACSGLNYLSTGFVLGTLYAFVMYRSWKKRLAFMAAAIVIPILANGLRVYLTILVAHLTDMRWGTGYDHIVLGNVLFLVVVISMFWIGKRWRDDTVAIPRAAEGREARKPRSLAFSIAPIGAGLALLTAAPVYLDSILSKAAANIDAAADAIRLVVAPSGWSGPAADVEGWRPQYRDPVAEAAATYQAPDGVRVQVFVGVYGLGVTAGTEMISYRNRLHRKAHVSLMPERSWQINDDRLGPLSVREATITESGTTYLVWYWYLVGDQVALSPYGTKLLEALAFARGGGVMERIVTLAVPLESRDQIEEARAALTTFMRTDPVCVRSGFDAQACSG